MAPAAMKVLQQHLKSLGFPVQQVAWSSDPSCEDDSLIINNAVSVQITRGGFCVNAWTPDGQAIRSFPLRRSPSGKFLEDLKRAVAEHPVTPAVVFAHAALQISIAHISHAGPNAGPFTPYNPYKREAA